MHPDDERLVRALLLKDEAAFVVLVTRLQPRLVAMARRIVGDEQAADDVVQETWGRVLKYLARFEGQSRLDTWITQIAINRARTRSASAKRDVPLSSFAGSDDRDPLEGAFTAIGRFRESPGTWQPAGPDARASDRELAAIVVAALQELPEQQRIAVSMRDVEGYDVAAVSAVLGITDDHQRVVLHRGRTRLRQLVATRLADPVRATTTTTTATTAA